MKQHNLLSSISFRLLAFNILIVFFPVASMLFLKTFEEQLLQSLEHALVQQGRITAAALSGGPELTRGNAERLLLRLEKQHDARIRILDREGRVLADSSVLPKGILEPASQARSVSAPDDEGREPSERFLYRMASFPVRLMRNYLLPPAVPIESGDFYQGRERLLGEEVLTALEGRYGAVTRISSGGQRSVTLYSALPIRREAQIIGAVLVSQSTFRILQDLYSVRLDIFKIFLISLLAAVLISILVSLTISRPLKKLSGKAREIFTPRGKLQGRFSTGNRKDEIGELAGALDRLTEKLREHISFIESFASDISHELKNPIASIRSSAEIVADTLGPDNDETGKFLTIIQREASRMERLISAVRDITSIDARMEEEDKEEVDLGVLAGLIVEGFKLRADNKRISFHLKIPEKKITVSAAPHRLTQVFENIINNAVSFTPPEGSVFVRIYQENQQACITVLDEGPGIPEDITDKIFTRFFSSRSNKQDFDGGHAGLGLAIVQAIVRGYSGTVEAVSKKDGGACLTVRLPKSVE